MTKTYRILNLTLGCYITNFDDNIPFIFNNPDIKDLVNFWNTDPIINHSKWACVHKNSLPEHFYLELICDFDSGYSGWELLWLVY